MFLSVSEKTEHQWIDVKFPLVSLETWWIPHASLVICDTESFSECSSIFGRKRGDNIPIIAIVGFLGATKWWCYWKVTHFVNAKWSTVIGFSFFIPLNFLKKMSAEYHLLLSEIWFYGFWNLSDHFTCCTKLFLILWTSSALLLCLALFPVSWYLLHIMRRSTWQAMLCEGCTCVFRSYKKNTACFSASITHTWQEL